MKRTFRFVERLDIDQSKKSYLFILLETLEVGILLTLVSGIGLAAGIERSIAVLICGYGTFFAGFVGSILYWMRYAK